MTTRAALQQAKTRLCPCGIEATSCNAHRNPSATEESA